MEVWTKNILYQFLEGQIHFGMSSVWPSMNQNTLPFIQIQTLPKSMHQWEGIINIKCNTTNGKS